MTDAITPDMVRDWVEQARPWEGSANEACIVGYAGFCSDWLADNPKRPDPRKRQTARRDDLDTARDAISTLRKQLPIIREKRSPIYRLAPDLDRSKPFNYPEMLKTWQAKCDRLQEALFDIGKTFTPAPAWHRWAIDAANAFAAITGIETISRTGPAQRFVLPVLVHVYGHKSAAALAIEEAVSNYRADTQFWGWEQERFADQLREIATRRPL